MPDLAKPEGHKLIVLFFDIQEDALDKRLLTHRRYEAISRPSWTECAFFATEKHVCFNFIHGKHLFFATGQLLISVPTLLVIRSIEGGVCAQ